MNFTIEEEKMITKLRKQQKWWKYGRIGGIILGICFLALLVWNYRFGCCIMVAPYGILALWCIQMIMYGIENWAGRPELCLLLKLLEEKKNENSQHQEATEK